jgi:ABC-type uncharacterized transport system ATPase subunit
MLGDIPGVLDIQPDGSGWRLEVEHDQVREVIFDRAAANHVRLLEMRPLSLTLEDIFLNLVGEKRP